MSKFSFTFYLKFPGIITPGSQAGIGGGDGTVSISVVGVVT